jgi:hypothetical protein
MATVTDNDVVVCGSSWPCSVSRLAGRALITGRWPVHAHVLCDVARCSWSKSVGVIVHRTCWHPSPCVHMLRESSRPVSWWRIQTGVHQGSVWPERKSVCPTDGFVGNSRSFAAFAQYIARHVTTNLRSSRGHLNTGWFYFSSVGADRQLFNWKYVHVYARWYIKRRIYIEQMVMMKLFTGAFVKYERFILICDDTFKQVDGNLEAFEGRIQKHSVWRESFCTKSGCCITVPIL